MAKRVIPVLLVAILGFVAWRYWGRGGDDPNRIILHGSIELTEVDLSFKVAGKVAELKVDEGALVKKGDLVARLERTETERTKEREEASLQVATTSLTQLRTGIDYQNESVESDILLKEADVRQAEARLSELLAGSRPQEVEQARAAAEEAKTQHQQAQKDWERAQRLYKNEDISTAQYDQFRTRADATAAALRKAEEMAGMVKEGPRKETIEAARAQLERAKAAVRFAQAGKLEVRRRQEEVATRRAEIARAEAQVRILDTQLNDRLLVSPTDGVVLTKAAEPGEVLAAGAALVTLGDLARPWVRGYINERDLGRVKLNQTANVTTDSYPGKVYPGKITFISSEAEFTPKAIQTQEERVKLVYRIKIELSNPNQELKLNMPVDAEIRLQ